MIAKLTDTFTLAFIEKIMVNERKPNPADKGGAWLNTGIKIPKWGYTLLNEFSGEKLCFVFESEQFRSMIGKSVHIEIQIEYNSYENKIRTPKLYSIYENTDQKPPKKV